jgi:hypothetical protein
MTNRFLVSVAALALIAGTGFANAQGGRESGGGAQMQSAPSSAGGAATEHENSKAASPSSGMKSEKSPAAGQGQRAEESTPGQKSKSMSSENETKGAPNNMKAEGREDRNANKAAESKQPGRENEKNAQTQGSKENMQAQGREGRETNQNAQSRTQTNTTVGQAGAGAKLSTEQRSKITTIIRNEHVAPVSHVDFAVSVGTRVPREHISLRPLPGEVVTVYPEWRGYEFFMVGDKIVVVDPRTQEIVDILEA